MKRITIPVLVAVTLSMASVLLGPAAQAVDTTILDTLGTATRSTTFSVFGSGGLSIFSSQLVGPRFMLSEDTVITEIGAFLNNCASIVGGVPQCPDALPLTVQIRPSVAGLPDPSTVLATLVLSHDDDPLMVSYESVSPNLKLEPGEYFALFAPQQEQDGGFLLASTNEYRAGIVTMGFLDPTSGDRSASDQFAAVRIVGHSLGASDLLNELLNDVIDQNAGPGASLESILRDTRRALEAENTTSACQLLDAFVQATTAQSGKSLLPDQAAALIDAATDIQEALGC
jgi:hypothetical protein